MELPVHERRRKFCPGSRALAVALTALALGGCTSITKPFDDYLPLITQFGVYKLDINQGNYLSQDMVEKLKVGQTKPQVRAALGTPLITSAFRDNRWDYVYEFKSAGRLRDHRQFTVYFQDDLLARWEGDEMPQSAQDLNRIAATRSLPADPYGQDAGIIGKIIDVFNKVIDPTKAAVP
jgi:outer membrane protein assembly factor BamE